MSCRMDIHELIGKLPRRKKGFVLPYHRYTGSYNPVHEQLDENDQPLPGQEQYNAVDTISMQHDISYRDNNSKEGKLKCDDEMLHELHDFQPKDTREKIDKSLVRFIIGKKLEWGIEWSKELANELHKRVRREFVKRRVLRAALMLI